MSVKLPDGLSVKMQKSLAGKVGARKSKWRLWTPGAGGRGISEDQRKAMEKQK